jgi:hypothetical protein
MGGGRMAAIHPLPPAESRESGIALGLMILILGCYRGGEARTKLATHLGTLLLRRYYRPPPAVRS